MEAGYRRQFVNSDQRHQRCQWNPLEASERTLRPPAASTEIRRRGDGRPGTLQFTETDHQPLFQPQKQASSTAEREGKPLLPLFSSRRPRKNLVPSGC